MRDPLSPQTGKSVPIQTGKFAKAIFRVNRVIRFKLSIIVNLTRINKMNA
jgi:hypothetical protein